MYQEYQSITEIDDNFISENQAYTLFIYIYIQILILITNPDTHCNKLYSFTEIIICQVRTQIYRSFDEYLNLNTTLSY